MSTSPAETWTNWSGNQSFVAPHVYRPADEAQYIDTVQRLVRNGEHLRVAGSGHSFTPLVETDGNLIEIPAVAGVLGVDAQRNTAEILAGTQLMAIGAPLWDAGFAILNQGDTDTQTISGAIATATKGSGRKYGNISSGVVGLRIVNGLGEVVDIDESTPEWLLAGRVSLGLLGAVTRVTLSVQPRYLLREHNRVTTIDDFLAHWSEYVETYRHASIFYCVSDQAAAMYDLGPLKKGDTLIKLLSEETPQDGVEYGVEGEHDNRTGRSHLVFPDVTTEVSTHVEAEYQLDARVWLEAFSALRELCERYPEGVSPIQVRWQKGDGAYLSPQYERDTVAISVSATRLPDSNVFLRKAHAVLMPFGARPHWGKMHYATPAEIAAAYPKLEEFKHVRAEFDPDGLFLNSYLRDLLSI
jgi:FAD/FMN-containing dehydrogenase